MSNVETNTMAKCEWVVVELILWTYDIMHDYYAIGGF